MISQQCNTLLSRNQAAKLLGVGYGRVRSLQEQGRLKGKRTGKGWRFDAEHVRALKRALDAEARGADAAPLLEGITGELAAEAFQMATEGASAIDFVLRLRVTTDIAQQLSHAYHRLRDHAVLSGSAQAVLRIIATDRKLPQQGLLDELGSGMYDALRWAAYRRVLRRHGLPELELVAYADHLGDDMYRDGLMRLPEPESHLFNGFLARLHELLERELPPLVLDEAATEPDGDVPDTAAAAASVQGSEATAGDIATSNNPMPEGGGEPASIEERPQRMTRGEIAKRLRLTYSRVRTLQEKGVLRAERDESGVWYAELADVERYAAESALPELADTAASDVQPGELHARVFEMLGHGKSLIDCVLTLKVAPELLTKLADDYARMYGYGTHWAFIATRGHLDANAKTTGWTVPWHDSEHAARLLLAIYRACLDWKQIRTERKDKGLPPLHF